MLFYSLFKTYLIFNNNLSICIWETSTADSGKMGKGQSSCLDSIKKTINEIKINSNQKGRNIKRGKLRKNLWWCNFASDSIDDVRLLLDSSFAAAFGDVGHGRDVANCADSQRHGGSADVVNGRRRKKRPEETELRPDRRNKETAGDEEQEPTCTNAVNCRWWRKWSHFS